MNYWNAAINKADATKMPSNTNSAHYWFQSIKNETYQNADCPPLVSKQTSSTWPTKDINFHNQLERAAKHADYYKEAINEKVSQAELFLPMEFVFKIVVIRKNHPMRS